MEDLLNGKKTTTKNKNALEYWNDHICGNFCLYRDQCHNIYGQEKTECI